VGLGAQCFRDECKFARNSGSDAILVVSWLTGADDACLE
jgi:hypothetical protein